MQNHPNPFNLSTSISFYLSGPEFVSIKIFNLKGKEIETVVEQTFESGLHRIIWDASNYSSGIYICRLIAGEYKKTRKIILQK